MGRIANQRKVSEWLLFENCKTESQKILYVWTRGIFTPNIKFLCITLWLGALSTDNHDDAVHTTDSYIRLFG